jgi:hypothetical protein
MNYCNLYLIPFSEFPFFKFQNHYMEDVRGYVPNFNDIKNCRNCIIKCVLNHLFGFVLNTKKKSYLHYKIRGKTQNKYNNVDFYIKKCVSASRLSIYNFA